MWIWGQFILVLYCDHCFLWHPVVFHLILPACPFTGRCHYAGHASCSHWVMPLPLGMLLVLSGWCLYPGHASCSQWVMPLPWTSFFLYRLLWCHHHPTGTTWKGKGLFGLAVSEGFGPQWGAAQFTGTGRDGRGSSEHREPGNQNTVSLGHRKLAERADPQK